jgi:hypothetical protein
LTVAQKIFCGTFLCRISPQVLTRRTGKGTKWRLSTSII